MVAGAGHDEGPISPYAEEDNGAVILVVDDTPASVRLLSGLLEVRGYKVMAAESGEQALDLIRDNPPDLILLDLLLPGVDGLEVCRRLRADLETQYLPIVMLTAAGNEERLHALEAGADDFLSKPIDHGELLARVRSLLRIKSYHDRVESQAAELTELNNSLESRVAAQVEELSRLSRLRRFFPPKVADLVTSADERWLLETHRQEVAVIFCDLRGFTAFAHSAEPEEVMNVLREFHRATGDCVHQYGATVGWLSGDGLMVFLNDPVRCADLADSAVDLSMRLQKTVDDLLARWRHEGHQLGMGVGAAQGYATLGILGVDERVEYVPVGSVVNLASRLCDRALDGEILISQSVHAALRHVPECERTEPMELRGFPAPVTGWRLFHRDRPVERAPTEAWSLPEPVVAAGVNNAFQKQDDGWVLTYRAQTIRVRDSKGLGYIARLMAVAGREIHVADLIGLARPEAAALRSDSGPVIDDRARRAYQSRLHELDAERDEANDWGDLERAARAEEEIAFLTQELTTAYGLGGRARRLDDPSERMRKAVTNRIRQTVAKVEGLHPELGRHLRHSVRTGTFCAYAPENPVEWML